MATQKKIETVEKLTEKISRAKSIVLADYRGLKHKQMEELRKLLKKSEAEFVVAKNRLFKKALGDKAEKVKDSLKQTTAVLFSYADEVAPLKELLKYFKTAGFGVIKVGLMAGNVMTEPDLARLSLLPTRQVLLAQLVSQLNSPIQGLHYALQWNLKKLVYALDAVKNNKSL